MAGLPTYGSRLCFGLPEPNGGPVAHLGIGQEKRGYPLTVAGTAADLRANPRTTFPFHPSFLRHHLT
jgi:hypothetical protein